MQIEIVEPRQSWAEDFENVKKIVMQAVPAGAYLHHIGSTAVPGLATKDIIDMQLTVESLASALEKLLGNPARLARMAAAARSVAIPDAAERLADVVEQTARMG